MQLSTSYEVIMNSNLQHFFKLMFGHFDNFDDIELNFYYECGDEDEKVCEQIENSVEVIKNVHENTNFFFYVPDEIEIERLTFADAILKNNINFFTHPSCGHCSLLKSELEKKGVFLYGAHADNHKDLGDTDHFMEYFEELQRSQGNADNFVPFVTCGDIYDLDMHNFIFKFSMSPVRSLEEDRYNYRIIFSHENYSYFDVSQIIGNMIDYTNYLHLEQCYFDIVSELGEDYMTEHQELLMEVELNEKILMWIDSVEENCGPFVAEQIREEVSQKEEMLKLSLL